MSGDVASVALKAAGVAGVLCALALPFRGALPAPVAEVIPPAESGFAPQLLNSDSLAAAAVARHPFRAARRPGLPFDPARLRAAPEPEELPPPVMPLRLTGILAGSEPAALIDGVTGTEGTRVVRPGERAGDYTVRTIAPDHVVLAGRDTVITLRLNRIRE